MSALPYRADIQLAERDLAWDAVAAEIRVRELAGWPDATDWALFERAFLYVEHTGRGRSLGAYRLPVADVVDGELRVVPRAVFAAAGGRGVDRLEGVSAEDRRRIKTTICRWYRRMAEEFEDATLVCPFAQELRVGAARYAARRVP